MKYGEHTTGGRTLVPVLGAALLLGSGCDAVAGWRERAGASALPAVSAPGPAAEPEGVTALGRLEPRDGVIRLAGPSQFSVVIAELFVEKGDAVEKGQVLALLDTALILKANMQRLEAELVRAQRDLTRCEKLHKGKIVSDQLREDREISVQVIEAQLRAARAEFARAHVRSPLDGQVIDVHTYPGERVGPQGILELARTGEMFAIAEVYETDIRRVRVGQQATAISPALERPLTGRVERIQAKVGKQDVLGTDPAAKTDARVVEVEIRLDESEPAAALTNLQVEVTIAP